MKKVVSLLLVLVLSIGMMSVAAAANLDVEVRGGAYIPLEIPVRNGDNSYPGPQSDHKMTAFFPISQLNFPDGYDARDVQGEGDTTYGKAGTIFGKTISGYAVVTNAPHYARADMWPNLSIDLFTQDGVEIYSNLEIDDVSVLGDDGYIINWKKDGSYTATSPADATDGTTRALWDGWDSIYLVGYKGGAAATQWYIAQAWYGRYTSPTEYQSLPGAATFFGDDNLSYRAARDAKFTVKLRTSKGNKAIKDYGIENEGGAARLFVEFQDPFKDIDDDGVDVDMTIELYIDGDLAYEWDHSGSYGNQVVEVWDDDDYINIDDGEIARGEEYNASVDLDLGHGVYVNTKIFKDKCYWGMANVEPDAQFDVVHKQYPDIDRMYSLDYLYINSTAQHVKLMDERATVFWVYAPDADGNLIELGTSDKELDFYDRYYLAWQQLDLEVAEDEPEDIEDIGEDIPEDIPVTGGDDTYPENINDNPGTGK